MGEERQIRQVRSARQMPVRVQLLDDEILDVAVDKRAVGWVLFDIVCEQLNVIEKDYFGLNYINPEGVKYWLDNEKKIAKQMKGLVSLNLCFEVKFYPIDPLQMVEDITRYQLCLQIRRDIVNERVPCSTVTYALLGSFTAQSELGDFEVEDFGSGTSYLKDIQFAPKQDRDLLAQIAKLHKQHKGMTPEEAEIKFLENAEKLQFYGVEQHPAKDADGKDISLGVCASGILVYKDRQQVNRFVWPKILKMSYKRNKFYIKIRPGEFENFASLIGFRTVSVKMAKRLWKICVEHHSFFRFKEPESVKKYSVIPRFGSRFRYSGRTQYQSRQYVTAEDRDMPSFDRVLSKRGTFGGRTQNMRKRDEDRKRQRDQMRREPPPPPVQQDFGPPQTKIPKENHEGPNGTPQEPKRTPPEPKHAPPVAPKPKPNIAPKPKPASRGPPSIDSASLDRGSRGSLNDSFEDVPDRRSRMEKMNAVMTPLAAVMQKSLQQNKHPDDEEVDGNQLEDDRHHTDDEFEVGMKADKARNRSGLTNTDHGCRNTDKYLFSYPSSSIDSILSNDFVEYDTESSSFKNGLKNVASEEFLNKPCNSYRNRYQEGTEQLKGNSHSTENLLSEQNVSHYTEIDPMTSEGIYAEIEDLKTSIPSTTNTPLQESRINRPASIHGRRSKFFKPNQSNSSTKFHEDEGIKGVSTGSYTKTDKRFLSKERGKQYNESLELSESHVPGYATVDKKGRKIPLSPFNTNVSDGSELNKSVDLSMKTQMEPFYDSIENTNESTHQRQDSQTSLKEELKMYIINPEKVKYNSETVKESNESSNKENFDQTNIKAFPKNSDENDYMLSEENNDNFLKLYESMELNELDQVESMTTNEEPLNTNINDNSIQGSQDISFNISNEESEKFGPKIDLISASAERKQIYQITYDTSALNSPETPKELPGEPEKISDSQQNISCYENTYIPNISKNSNSVNLTDDDENRLNDVSLDKSLELFCSLSTDSSDFDEHEYINQEKIRNDYKVTHDSTKDNREHAKLHDSKLHEKGLNNDKSEDEKVVKPKTMLKKVSSLVKKVPGLGSKISKRKEIFICEEFDQEPVRRMQPVSSSSISKSISDLESPYENHDTNLSKDSNKTVSNIKPIVSDYLETFDNTIKGHDRKTDISCSECIEEKRMDFFTKPKTLDEFVERKDFEFDSSHSLTNISPIENTYVVKNNENDTNNQNNHNNIDANNLPTHESNKICLEKEKGKDDKSPGLESPSNETDYVSKVNRSPDPFWYKTHLLASNNSSIPEKTTGAHQLQHTHQQDRHPDIRNSTDNTMKCDDFSSPYELKVSSKRKEIKSKADATLKSESQKQVSKKSSSNVRRSSPPEVKGSKVFVRDQTLNSGTTSRQPSTHNKVELPLIPATNIVHKPLYKLDYSSDSSSSFSSLNSKSDKNATSQAKIRRRKSKSSRSENPFEKKLSNERKNIPTSINLMTDRRKVYPGVVHLVKPGAVGWIQGGVKSSVLRRGTKLDGKVKDDSPNDYSKILFKGIEKINDSSPLKSGSECSSKEIIPNQEISHRNDEAYSDAKEDEMFAESANDSGHKEKENEIKNNVNNESLQHNTTSPLSELLCKRVWKYSKHKKDNKDSESNKDDGSDDDFKRAIEKGPDYTDNFGVSTSSCPSRSSGNTNANQAEKSSSKDKVNDQSNQSSFGNYESFDENEHLEKERIEMDLQTDQNGSQSHDGCVLNICEDVKETLEQPNKLNGNCTSQTQFEEKQEQTCVFEIDEFILDTGERHIIHNTQTALNRISTKRKRCTEINGETESEGTTSTSDSSSENSYDIDDEESSGEEIVSFEMPKPSLTEFTFESNGVDVPFADETGDSENDATLIDLSSIAIDCSFEDVTSYQVDRRQSKNLDIMSSESVLNQDLNNLSQNGDNYDVNYWDEDIEFSDYDDPMGEVEDTCTIPQVIDHTPYNSGKSNLKSSVRKETSLSNRRVHFPENLPVYKSTKNIGFHDDEPSDETSMNRANEERNKLNQLEKFIIGLFDEEPRNLSIPRLKSNTDSLLSPSSQFSEDFEDVSNNDHQTFGYHSSVTSENVNFSLDPLQTFAINEMHTERDIITTDLDDIDYHDRPFELTFGRNSQFDMSDKQTKTEKRPSPKIIKPVTGKKTKYSHPGGADKESSKSYQTSDLFPLRSQTNRHSDQHYTSSCSINQHIQPYKSQCSAELLNNTSMYSQSNPGFIPNEFNTFSSDSISQLNHSKNQDIEPPDYHEINGVEQTNKLKTDEYIDVSGLSKIVQIQETKPKDKNKITSERNDDQIKQDSIYPSPDKVTRYSYSYADDSDPESPKIKYVTYEYVTEYKLNNVKIHYQHNKKVQTDLNLIQQENENPGHISSKLLSSDESEQDNESENTEGGTKCNKHREVIEEIVEPSIRKSFCVPLEDSDGNVHENAKKHFSNTSTETEIPTKNEILGEVVTPYQSKAHAISLEEDPDCCKEIRVEEVKQGSVCNPLGPIIGAHSDNFNYLREAVVEDEFEKFITHQTKSSTGDRNNHIEQANRADVTYKEKSDSSDRSIDTQKTISQNLDNQLNDSKDNTSECFGKSYTEKQVLEYNSEKYVFQCYQPTMYSTKRFPRYLPGCKRREKAENLNEEILHFGYKKETLHKDFEDSVEKGTEDSFEIEILDFSKELQDSDNVYSNDNLQEDMEAHMNDKSNALIRKSLTDKDVKQFRSNDKNIQAKNKELSPSNVENTGDFYTKVMQEELPQLCVDESTLDDLLVMQTIIVMAFGAVLVFLFPYMS